MGGGGLVILPKKSWNVWNKDNLAVVAEDEAEHKLELEARERKRQELTFSMKYDILSKKSINIEIRTEEEMKEEIEKLLIEWDPKEYMSEIRMERLKDEDDEDDGGKEVRRKKRKRREMESERMEKLVRRGKMSEIVVEEKEKEKKEKKKKREKLTISRDIESTRIGKSSVERLKIKDLPWYCSSYGASQKRKKLERSGSLRDKKKSTKQLQELIDQKKAKEDPMAIMDALFQM